MSRLTWDTIFDKKYENGVDRGAWYPDSGKPGVPWHGLVSVDVNSNTSDPEPIYYDGFKQFNLALPVEFNAGVSTYTYPDELEACIGYDEVIDGVSFGEGIPIPFNFTYRTLVDGGKYYKIHLVYHCTATPGASTYNTISADPGITTFNWKLVTVPEYIDGRRATSYIVLDSRRVDAGILESIENILYGGPETEPRFPTVQEIADLTSDVTPIIVTKLGDGVFSILAPTRYLEESKINPGSYVFSGPTWRDEGDGAFEVHSQSDVEY